MRIIPVKFGLRSRKSKIYTYWEKSILIIEGWLFYAAAKAINKCLTYINAYSPCVSIQKAFIKTERRYKKILDFISAKVYNI